MNEIFYRSYSRSAKYYFHGRLRNAISRTQQQQRSSYAAYSAAGAERVAPTHWYPSQYRQRRFKLLIILGTTTERQSSVTEDGANRRPQAGYIERQTAAAAR